MPHLTLMFIGGGEKTMPGIVLFFAACLSYIQAPGNCQEMRKLPECPQVGTANNLPSFLIPISSSLLLLLPPA